MREVQPPAHVRKCAEIVHRERGKREACSATRERESEEEKGKRQRRQQT